MPSSSLEFVWGALAMASFVAFLLFMRFWQRTRERLFVLFGAAFLVFSLNWTILGLVRPGDESRPYVYLFRWLAFLLILAAILDKNRR